MNYKIVIINFACILICIHLILISLAPFPNTLAYKYIPKIGIKYLNQIGTNYRWNLFTPEPMATTRIVLSYYHDKIEEKQDEIIVPVNESLYGMSALRKFYIYNYFLSKQERMLKSLRSLICKNKAGGFWLIDEYVKKNGVMHLYSKNMVRCD